MVDAQALGKPATSSVRCRNPMAGYVVGRTPYVACPQRLYRGRSSLRCGLTRSVVAVASGVLNSRLPTGTNTVDMASQRRLLPRCDRKILGLSGTPSGRI